MYISDKNNGVNPDNVAEGLDNTSSTHMNSSNRLISTFKSSKNVDTVATYFLMSFM